MNSDEIIEASWARQPSQNNKAMMHVVAYLLDCCCLYVSSSCCLSWLLSEVMARLPIQIMPNAMSDWNQSNSLIQA